MMVCVIILIPGNPDPPIIQEASVLSASSVLLKWNTTADQSVANFSVELSVDFVAWEQPTCNNSLVQGACVVTQKQAVLMFLQPYTNYTFRVVARNQFGRSNYSTESKWVLTGEAGTVDGLLKVAIVSHNYNKIIL